MYKRFKKQEKGQGLVEYALILVLVAIVVIATLMVLGPIIGNVFSTINSSISNIGGVTKSSCEAGGGIWYPNHDNSYYCWNPPE